MTRIKVHLASDKQTVSKHRKSHKNILRDHSVLPGKFYIQTLNNKRNGAHEAFEIQNRSGNIMNVCIGRTICIYNLIFNF